MSSSMYQVLCRHCSRIRSRFSLLNLYPHTWRLLDDIFMPNLHALNLLQASALRCLLRKQTQRWTRWSTTRSCQDPSEPSRQGCALTTAASAGSYSNLAEDACLPCFHPPLLAFKSLPAWFMAASTQPTEHSLVMCVRGSLLLPSRYQQVPLSCAFPCRGGTLALRGTSHSCTTEGTQQIWRSGCRVQMAGCSAATGA